MATCINGKIVYDNYGDYLNYRILCVEDLKSTVVSRPPGGPLDTAFYVSAPKLSCETFDGILRLFSMTVFESSCLTVLSQISLKLLAG